MALATCKAGFRRRRGETQDWQDLAHRSRSDLEAAGLHPRLDHVATQIDADRHTLALRNPDGGHLIVG